MSGETALRMQKICVFCGSSLGKNAAYKEAGVKMGQELVKRNIGLVYGGGSVGLMGVIANTVADGLGHENVIGVLPDSMGLTEVCSRMLGQTILVPDMHTRKATMAQHADGFITMPGGFGTLDELMEALTWQQLGYHNKPIALLNVDGFFDPLLDYINKLVEEGFITEVHAKGIIVSSDPAALLDSMSTFKAAKGKLEMAKLGEIKADVIHSAADGGC